MHILILALKCAFLMSLPSNDVDPHIWNRQYQTKYLMWKITNLVYWGRWKYYYTCHEVFFLNIQFRATLHTRLRPNPHGRKLAWTAMSWMNSIGSLVHLNQCYSSNSQPFMQVSSPCGLGLRSRDHYTSSTLIGGKGGTSPSSLHITLEGPTSDWGDFWA